MKIGYPCINTEIGCTANRTFRLANYSEENIKIKVKNNLDCLYEILKFNAKNNLLFFRIGSKLIPFASHPTCKFNWAKFFKKDFNKISEFIKKNNIRISMHPDQFVIINPLNKEILKRSIKDLNYHCKVLDTLGLDSAAKIQVHVGGIYGNKEKSINRFIFNYKRLSKKLKRRLVIENDDRLFSFKDCLAISKEISIPIVFDVFHHKCLNNNESVKDALKSASRTWNRKDGILMVDYSSQKRGSRKGSHTKHINLKDFEKFLKEAKGINFDIMLEIKDKEKSALEAVEYFKKKDLISNKFNF